MTWALWLAAPIGATVLAALWAWWRGWRVRRANRPLTTEQAVRAHEDYLDALVVPARSAARPEPPAAQPATQPAAPPVPRPVVQPVAPGAQRPPPSA